MRTQFFVALLSLLSFEANADIAFERPPSPGGGLIVSSWVDPNGSDADTYAYDEFIVAADAAIAEVDWRGGYSLGAPYGPVTNFSVTFFDSIAGGSQPHLGNPQLEDTSPIYLAKYYVGGNAGEAPVGASGLYDYRFVLPTAFHAVAGTKYWLRIEASQSTYPDWGIAVGTGGDGNYFQFITGRASFLFVSGDIAFTLLTSAGPTTTPTPSFAPTQTPTSTPAATNTATPTATATPKPCVGDCNGNMQVTVDEILTMVNIALNNLPVTSCLAGDQNGDGRITVDEILAAVNKALNGCVHA
ncbi:MAG: hypothetical protein ACHQ9S_23205 [Candidatus Binatia bacterium]